MRNLNAIMMIAYRDIKKLFRDRSRIIAALIFPLVFVGLLGNSLESNLGDEVAYSFLQFTFAGVLGMTLFQSTASGIISLVEDRKNDFAQEIFVSPISRYSIIVGKILGESAVAFIQLFMIMILGVFLGASIDLATIVRILPAAVAVCFLGGAFGVLIMSQLGNERSANQIFPFIIFPQYFLAGVFSPINSLPPVLLIVSRLMPMTYAVDLVRNVFFWGTEEIEEVVLFNVWVDLAVVLAMSVSFLLIGTWAFVRNERNR